jgi:hypothetical protein
LYALTRQVRRSPSWADPQGLGKVRFQHVRSSSTGRLKSRP